MPLRGAVFGRFLVRRAAITSASLQAAVGVLSVGFDQSSTISH